MKAYFPGLTAGLALGVLSLSLGTGCVAVSSHQCCASAKACYSSDWYTNYFSPYPNSTGLKVLVTPPPGAKGDTVTRPILLLHELPGMTPQCLSLATNLASAGFKVYLPLMFGKPNDSAGFFHSLCNGIYLSLSPKWHIYRKSRTSPIVKDLRRLINDLDKTESSEPMGVIGMCLTGSMPLALLTQPSVHEVVLSQPATPVLEFTYKQKAALGLSASDLSFAKKRVEESHIPILGLRFATDKICQAPRFCTLQCQFGTNFEDLMISQCEYDENLLAVQAGGAEPHSVLCESYDNTLNSPTRIRFERVVSYLKKQLF